MTVRALSEKDILFWDEHYLAVNKPSGLFVHKSELDRRADFALHYVRSFAGCHVWPVHRLDRPTSGVLVFALSKEALRELSSLFRERRVMKTYLTVVRGYTEPSGLIDHPLAADKNNTPKQAVTEYTRLKTVELPYPVGRYPTARYSLVEVRPLTGRKHQIRRHFDHLFHPVIGDCVYGDGRHNRFVRDHFQMDRLLLAATELSFTHPFTGIDLKVSAPLCPDMIRVIRTLFE